MELLAACAHAHGLVGGIESDRGADYGIDWDAWAAALIQEAIALGAVSTGGFADTKIFEIAAFQVPAAVILVEKVSFDMLTSEMNPMSMGLNHRFAGWTTSAQCANSAVKIDAVDVPTLKFAVVDVDHPI